MDLGPLQIWIRLVEYSSSGVSSASEVSQSHGKLFFKIFKEVKLVHKLALCWYYSFDSPLGRGAERQFFGA